MNKCQGGYRPVDACCADREEASGEGRAGTPVSPICGGALANSKAVRAADGGGLGADVAAHGVQVFVLDAPVTQPALQAALDQAMAGARRPRAR